jgi:hypothetical protein
MLPLYVALVLMLLVALPAGLVAGRSTGVDEGPDPRVALRRPRSSPQTATEARYVR